MINNIPTDVRIQQSGTIKSSISRVSVPVSPKVLGFKTQDEKEKAILRVKKFKRSDNILIVGEIDDDYVDIVEMDDPITDTSNFFAKSNNKKKYKYLKNSYVVDYILSPKMRCGLGTEAMKGLVEKAMFDTRADGRIVTFCTPICNESSPAIFFYKLGFRFTDPKANEYINDCIIKKVPDLPPQKGMMYLPKNNINRLLRYGDVF